jgi:hypothetical protein
MGRRCYTVAVPKIPFTAYDIFAYVVSGLLVISAADFVFSGNWVIKAKLSVIQGLIAVVIAYVLGHVVSAVSAVLLEREFVERVLGPREEVLFAKAAPRFPHLFRGYSTPLPRQFRRLVLERARPAGFKRVDHALFLHCDAAMRAREETAPILATFLNVYGFARNACVASLIVAPLLVFGGIFGADQRGTKVLLGVAALLAAVGLLYRYLKFFHLYARDVFLFYGTVGPAGKTE